MSYCKLSEDNYKSFPVIVGCKPGGIDEECKNCSALMSAIKIAGQAGPSADIYKQAICQINGRMSFNGKIIYNPIAVSKIPGPKSKKMLCFMTSYAGEIALAESGIIAKCLNIIYDNPKQYFLILSKLPGLFRKKFNIAAKFLKKHGKDMSKTKNIHMGTSVGLVKYAFRIDQLRKFVNHPRAVFAKPLLGNLSEINLKGIDYIRINSEKARRNQARPCKDEWITSLAVKAKEQNVKVYIDKK